MIPINREGDHQGEKLGAMQQGPPKNSPILKTLLAENAQAKTGTEKGEEPLQVHVDLNPWRIILLKEGPDSPVVLLG